MGSFTGAIIARLDNSVSPPSLSIEFVENNTYAFNENIVVNEQM
ncbi:MAG: hypothetical protein RL023_262 [Candidatus Parcubacteria bacterium]|jgi:hypothetical protein